MRSYYCAGLWICGLWLWLINLGLWVYLMVWDSATIQPIFGCQSLSFVNYHFCQITDKLPSCCWQQCSNQTLNAPFCFNAFLLHQASSYDIFLQISSGFLSVFSFLYLFVYQRFLNEFTNDCFSREMKMLAIVSFSCSVVGILFSIHTSYY